MPLNLSPHEYAVDPHTNAPILTRIQPYIRLRDGNDPPMFLQAGKVYAEGGDIVPKDKWPFWLPEAIRQLGGPALDEVGFTEYVQKLNNPPSEPSKKG